VVTGTSGDEARDEGAEESFAPAARVVHELEEAEVVRRLCCLDQGSGRNAPNPVWGQVTRT
jgi:hypothetical protein